MLAVAHFPLCMYVDVSCVRHPFCLPRFIEKQLKSCVLCIIELCHAKAYCIRSSSMWQVLWHATYSYSLHGMHSRFWLQLYLQLIVLFVVASHRFPEICYVYSIVADILCAVDKLINIYCFYILKLAWRVRKMLHFIFFSIFY